MLEWDHSHNWPIDFVARQSSRREKTSIGVASRCCVVLMILYQLAIECNQIVANGKLGCRSHDD